MFKKNSMLKKRRRKNKFLRVFIFPIAAFGIFSAYYFFHSFFFSGSMLLSPLAHSFFVPINEKNIFAIKKGLADNHISARQISAKNDSYEVILSDGTSVLFSGNKPISLQISSLQLILSHFTIEGKKVSRVDFEFDKPVVTAQ